MAQYLFLTFNFILSQSQLFYVMSTSSNTDWNALSSGYTSARVYDRGSSETLAENHCRKSSDCALSDHTCTIFRTPDLPLVTHVKTNLNRTSQRPLHTEDSQFLITIVS